jgi:quercetin dioxygenase-like cupin family protein
VPIVRAAEGAPLQVLGDRVTVKVASADSPFQLSVVSVEVPPGSFIPPAHHRTEEECYFGLEGVLRVTLGGEQFDLAPGDLLHVPPGTDHAYQNPGATPVRFLAFSVGGPVDRFFAAIASDVRAMPADLPKLRTLMERYGVVPAGDRAT